MKNNTVFNNVSDNINISVVHALNIIRILLWGLLSLRRCLQKYCRRSCLKYSSSSRPGNVQIRDILDISSKSFLYVTVSISNVLISYFIEHHSYTHLVNLYFNYMNKVEMALCHRTLQASFLLPVV